MENSSNPSGERIRRKREELNLTQEKLADKCSVFISIIKNRESETHFPEKKDFLRLTEDLQSTPNHLIAFNNKDLFVLESTKEKEQLALSLLHKLLHPEIDDSND